jgi:hypothetical protein
MDIFNGFQQSIKDIKESMYMNSTLNRTSSILISTYGFLSNYTYTGASLFATTSTFLLNYIPVIKIHIFFFQFLIFYPL